MLNSIRPAWWVFRREVRDQFRDWRITIPIMLLTLVFPFIMNYMANEVVGFVAKYGATLLSERLVPFFLLIVGFFPISVSLVIALESFVGEKERGSIEPLLSTPLADWQLYLGKLSAVIITPLIGSYMGIGIYLAGAVKKFNWVPDPELLILILTLTLVQAFVMVSGAVVISTQATTVRSANLLASFIIIPVAFLIQAEAIVMFYGQYQTLWWVVFGLLVVSVLLARTGISHFNREELLGRELDILNFKWMWSVFKTQFVGEATSIRTWYSKEIRGTLRKLRFPFVVMFLIFIGAILFGSYLGTIFVLPEDIIDLSNEDILIDQLEIEMGKISFGQVVSAILFIWLHNIRAIAVNTFLGLFTFGILGIMGLNVAFVLLGFFAAPAVAVGIPAWGYWLGFVAPHGIVEIPGIILAGALVLKIGAGLAAPSKGESIGDGLLRSLADWAKIMVGVLIPLFLAASILEVLVTPQVVFWVLSN